MQGGLTHRSYVCRKSPRIYNFLIIFRENSTAIHSAIAGLNYLNGDDVVLPELVKHDRVSNAFLARFGHYL